MSLTVFSEIPYVDFALFEKNQVMQSGGKKKALSWSAKQVEENTNAKPEKPQISGSVKQKSQHLGQCFPETTKINWASLCQAHVIFKNKHIIIWILFYNFGKWVSLRQLKLKS